MAQSVMGGPNTPATPVTGEGRSEGGPHILVEISRDRVGGAEPQETGNLNI
jgi:hypothetical protein